MSSRYLRIVLVAAATIGWIGESWADSVNIRVNASTDDADENSTTMNLTSTTLDLGSKDWVGQRFKNVTIPQGAYIISAFVTYRANTTDNSVALATVYGEAVDNSATFTTAASNISGRTKTAASVAWNSIPAWTANTNYNTPELRTIVQEIVNRSGWASGNSLTILVQKGANQRSAKSYNGSTSRAPLLHVDYAVVTRPIANRLLYVVTNTSSPSTYETQRKTFFQDIGYTVTLIAASDSQASFDAASAANDVAYISEDIYSSQLNTKLTSKPLGIVNEEPALSDDFAVASTYSSPSTSAITIAKNNHYITSAFATGSLTITSSVWNMNTWTGTLAPDLNTLATIGGVPSLVVVETNGKLYDGTTAAGRRVFLPWSQSIMDLTLFNDNGYLLLSRALAWAGGVVGYWKLDETSGTAAGDSSVNNQTGTLNNCSFATSAVPTAKVDGALRCDGADDYISVPNNSVFQFTKALSVSAWIYGRSWGSGSYANVVLCKGDSNPNNWQLAIENGYATLGLDGNDGTNVHGNTLLQKYRWHHVVGTWDGSNIRIYVNGVLDNTPTARYAPINTDTRPVYLGGRIGNTDVFAGIVDDVRLFNYALDADEVTILRGQGRPFVTIIRWEEIQ